MKAMSNLIARNITSSSIAVSGYRVSSTDSSNVEIVTVQRLSDNKPFKSFKFIYNFTPWYYVIDGVQTQWTDDLSSIGYELFVEPIYEFILFNEDTNKISYGVETLNETAFAETYHFTIDDETEIVFVQQLPTIITNMWSCPAYGDGIITLSPDGTYLLWNNLQDKSNISYDDSLAYAVNFWRDANNNLGGHTELSMIKQTSKLGIQNNSSQTLTVYWVNYSTCSSNQATVVTVYDTNNVAYNSFKFIMSETDYYYVLDGTQTDWTNDLSSIGYTLTPTVVLPTVSSDIWAVAKDADRGSLASQASIQAYDESNNAIAYNDSISYGVIEWKKYSPFNAFGGRTETALIKYTDTYSDSWVYIKNVSQSTINFFQLRYKTCSDSAAIVVTVYDTNNVAYNSFKYTANNTDYYYVLDGVQTNWTDDLSSIGYSETPTLPTVLPVWFQPAYNYAGTVIPAGDYYFAFVIDNTDKSALQQFGVPLASVDYGSGAKYRVTGATINNYLYGFVDLYSGLRETPLHVDRSNYSLTTSTSDQLRINATNQSPTFYTWKCGIVEAEGVSLINVYDSQNAVYNSFKYTVNNTDYYYVLDGTHTDWTDDLSSIGYSLTPTVVLPAVSVTGDYDTNNWLYARIDGTNAYVSSGSDILIGETDSHSHIISELYDDSKSYAIIRWSTYQGQQGSGRTEYSIVKGSDGYIHAKNVTSGALYLYALRCAVCSDSTATVVTVGDSQNNFYNAFKYTTNNTDYYYVLDEVQTDWTDDLSSIGYSRSIEVWFYLDRASASKTFDADDYWGTFIIDDTDRQILSNYGVTIYRNTFAQNQYQVDKTSIDNFSFEPLGLYSGVRTGDLGANMINFYCGTYTGGIYSSVVIKSINAYSTYSQTWKCRITKLS